MAKKRNRSKKKPEPVQLEEEDLDRFAGSSEEEDNRDEDHDEHDNSKDDESSANDEEIGEGTKRVAVDSKFHADADAEDSSDSEKERQQPPNADDSSDSEEEEEKAKTAGMANAMAKILGIKVSDGTRPVVLSKTKTPLQKIAEKEKQKEKEMREKRRVNRDKTLTALHKPLSVATTATLVQTGGDSKAISRELEQERTHRRVATRGVVALFNAITQHQKKSTEPTSSPAKGTQVKKMTKHGFLDMIKAKATSDSAETQKEKVSETKKKPQWNALRDDFMMNPKKNWDQDSSSDEEEGPLSSGDEDASGKNEESPAKKRKVRTQ